MSRLLYVKASPRGDRSYSAAAANAFVESYRQAHPGDEIVEMDVFKENLPAFDGAAVDAKYAILHGANPTPDQVQAWKAVEAVIAKFKSADKYLFAVPMWNFGIPYRLKQLFDVIVQPTYTFSFSPKEGYKGLVTGKPALVICARGGAYAGSPGVDHQKPYMDLILGFIGFKDIRSIVIEPTLAGGPDEAKRQHADAIARARELAASF